MFVTVRFLDDDDERVISDLSELQMNKKKLKKWPSLGIRWRRIGQVVAVFGELR